MNEEKNKAKQKQTYSLQFKDKNKTFIQENGSKTTSGQIDPKRAANPKQTANPKKPHDKFYENAEHETPVDDELIGVYNNNNSKNSKNADKSKHEKLRENSNRTQPSDRFKHDPSSDKKNVRDKKQLNKSKFRMEKTGAKLEKAVDKKAKQKPYKKPGVINAAKMEAYRQIHGKIHEVEKENVGVEAAHKTEIAGERAVWSISRFANQRTRTRPARRVRNLKKRSIKTEAKYRYKKAVQENPVIGKNAISRFLQKQRLKRRYQRMARKAVKNTAKTAKRTAVTTGKIVGRVFSFIIGNPKIILIFALAGFLAAFLYSCVGSMTMIGNGIAGAISASTYLADDVDIDMAEVAYTEWETDLRLEIKNIETTRPGYDEYRYSVGTIDHDPYELIAFLTAVYDDFTYAGVESVLKEIFDEQYTLTTREITETKEIENEDGEIVTEEIKVLEVTLTVKPFAELLYSRMDSEQLDRYNILVISKGNRQYWYSPFPMWLPSATSKYGYRVHPIRGEKDNHRGIDISMPEGTVILSAQAGTVTFAGENGAYGLLVVIDDGNGLVSKYAHCSAFLVSVGQVVEIGEPIAEVGNTGSSTGPHLHMELIKDGQYLNPLFFALTYELIQ